MGSGMGRLEANRQNGHAGSIQNRHRMARYRAPQAHGRNRHYPHYWEGRQTDQAGPTVVKGGAGRIAAQVCLAAGGSASEMKVEHGIPIPRKPGLHAHRNLAFDAIDWSALGIGDSYRSRRTVPAVFAKRATAAG